MRIGDRAAGGGILRFPLRRAGRALRQLPLIVEEIVEVVVVPLRRARRPRAFESAGDRRVTVAAPKAVFPAQSLLFDRCTLGFGADVLLGIGGTMDFAERMPARDERDRFLVVHRHASERLSNVPRRCDRVRIAVRSFRVHVDQAHLNGPEGVREFTIAGIAFVAQPRLFTAPVDVFFRLPHVDASAAEAERPKPHRLQGAVAGKDHQVGPRNRVAVLLFDRPKQSARLVEVRVVGPTVERCEALRAAGCAAATVVDAIGAGAMPCHANEQRPVMTVVGGPPVLRARHLREDVVLQRDQVELLEFISVAKRRTHGVDQRRILVKNLEVQLVRPPVSIRHQPGVHVGALRSTVRYRATSVFLEFRFEHVLSDRR